MFWLLYKQNKKQTNKILLIRNRSNYISFSPQIAYKLIEAGRCRDILQIQGLSVDGLNNRENNTIQYIEYTNIKQKQIYYFNFKPKILIVLADFYASFSKFRK